MRHARSNKPPGVSRSCLAPFTGGRPNEPQGNFPGWGRSSVVKWQLRDLYVLDLRWISSLGPYCEPERIFYVDRENWLGAYTEAYDNNNKFWKLLLIYRLPLKYQGETTLLNDGDVGSMGYDFSEFSRHGSGRWHAKRHQSQ
jgi:hypothetical protein